MTIAALAICAWKHAIWGKAFNQERKPAVLRSKSEASLQVEFVERPWVKSKFWSVLALMRLTVVCLCQVRELDDEWRDSVDRGSRLPRAFLAGKQALATSPLDINVSADLAAHQ